jgi:hypothetical protein
LTHDYSLLTLRRFHLQRIVKPIEVVEKARSHCEFNNLSLVEMLAQLCPELLVNVVRIQRDAFGEAQRDFLLFGEVRTGLVIGGVIDLVQRVSVAFSLNAMGVQSIFAIVDLAHADEKQFLQFGRDGSGTHDGAEVRDHRAQIFRTNRHRSKHIRHVAAFLHVGIEDLLCIASSFFGSKTFDAHWILVQL